jgi:hypothetical protein
MNLLLLNLSSINGLMAALCFSFNTLFFSKVFCIYIGVFQFNGVLVSQNKSYIISRLLKILFSLSCLKNIWCHTRFKAVGILIADSNYHLPHEKNTGRSPISFQSDNIWNQPANTRTSDFLTEWLFLK